MEEAWIWYGPSDPVRLEDIIQTGATAISTALYEIEAGEIWSLTAILERKSLIESAGLQWSVVESIPVHETLKTRRPAAHWDHLMENYKETVVNLGRAGLDILSYSFSPLFDWLRTDIDYEWEDGSQALRFSMDLFRVFDIHVLQRSDAVQSYTPAQTDRALNQYRAMTNDDISRLSSVITSGLHGQTGYSVQELRDALKQWDGVDQEQLRKNHYKFLRALLPTAVEAGVLLSVHPDDPPRSVLGLPNILSSAEDFRDLFSSFPSPFSGLTFCLGSLASRKENDVVKIAEEFVKKIRFVHVRNVVLDGEDQDGLIEAGHIQGRGDLPAIVSILLQERARRISAGNEGALTRLPFRSDHGHLMLQDLRAKEKHIPGHSLSGRMRGLAEVRGIQVGILFHQNGNKL